MYRLFHDGRPVDLPYVASYQRDDNGEVWYAKVEGFTPPDPKALGLQARNRGVVRVVHSPNVDGPWGPPYRGADPAHYGLEIKETDDVQVAG